MDRKTVAIALTKRDYHSLRRFFNRIKPGPDAVRMAENPDRDVYVVLYWDYHPWDALDYQGTETPVSDLLKKLKRIRHAYITIAEDGTVFNDVEPEDDRGCDEFFYDILSWSTKIVMPDCHVPILVASKGNDCSLGAERVRDIFAEYLAQDAERSDWSCVMEMLQNIASEEEIKALGFGLFSTQAKVRGGE